VATKSSGQVQTPTSIIDPIGPLSENCCDLECWAGADTHKSPTAVAGGRHQRHPLLLLDRWLLPHGSVRNWAGKASVHSCTCCVQVKRTCVQRTCVQAYLCTSVPVYRSSVRQAYTAVPLLNKVCLLGAYQACHWAGCPWRMPCSQGRYHRAAAAACIAPPCARSPGQGRHISGALHVYTPFQVC